MRTVKSAAILALAGLLGLSVAAAAQDSDRIKGTGKEVTGTVEQKAGQLTGDRSLEAQGRNEHSEGMVENAWGKVKDAAREIGGAISTKLGGK